MWETIKDIAKLFLMIVFATIVLFLFFSLPFILATEAGPLNAIARFLGM